MKVLLMSGPGLFEGETRLLNLLLEQTGFELSIRKPGWDTEGVESMLGAMDPTHLNRIWIHGHPELALKFKTAGVHFGEKKKPEAHKWFAPLKEAGIRVGAACHDPKELESLGDYDRVLLSPIFESISKPGHIPSFESDDVRKALSKKPNGTEVFALGGIIPERFELILEMGFDGAALLGAVWAAQDPETSLKEILNQVEGP